MKYITTIAFLFLLASCCKDKIKTTPNPTSSFETLQTNTNETLTDISFLNDNEGLICGEFGFCAKTIDGGKSWTKLNTGFNYSFISAFILDNQNLYVARNGLYNSTNAGSNFNEKGNLSQNTSIIPNIYFIDKQNGFITHGGGIKKTIDGGLTWNEKYNTGVYYGLTNLKFTSNLIAYASGGRTFDQTNEGEIVKTIDGGNTWNKILSTINITSISFISNTEGYYSTFNKEIFKTSDGGNTWVKLSDLNYLPLSIVFLDKQIGYIATEEGKILKTINAGQNWSIVYENTSVPIIKIIATNNSVFAIGGNGLLIKTK